jgi:hypothetical protein
MPSPRRARTRPALVLAALFVTFFLILLAPVPDLAVLPRLLPLLRLRAPGTVAVAGNSVLSQISSCDRDQRTLPAMLQADLARPLQNLGFPGQQFEESLNYATIALRRPAVAGAVLYLSPFALTTASLPDLQTAVFQRLAASPAYQSNSLRRRLAQHSLLGPVDPDESGFTYAGAAYPNYDGVKQIYFSSEKSRESCPESLGHDRRFIEAYYWDSYLRRQLLPGHIDDLAQFARIAAAQHKQLLVVLLPVDVDDVRSLNPALAAELQSRLAAAAAALRAANVPLLDLSQSLPAQDFTDRWCACGHLAQAGRLQVAQRTSAAYSDAQPTPTPAVN